MTLEATEIPRSCSTFIQSDRASRISRRAFTAPASFSAEISIDAVNFAMHGLKGPNPVYEGEDSIVRRFLDGKNNPDAVYKVALAEPSKDKLRNIMMTYPKEHA